MRTITKREALTAIGGAAAGLALSRGALAQDAAWREAIAKARTEARVNLYSVAVPQQMEKAIAAFNKSFPEIRISHTRGAAELPPRIAAERQADRDGADVFVFADPPWFTQNRDFLAELKGPSAAGFPDAGWHIKGRSANVGFVPFSMLVWNTSFVKQPLSHHRDLLKPEFRGRVGTRDSVTAVLAGFMDFIEREIGPDYFPELAKQKPKFYSSGVPLIQAIASGEVWVGNVGFPGALRELKEQGAPIAWAVPKPKGFANPWVGGVLTTSRRPNAAQVFLDFLMSREGQLALNGDESSASAYPDLKGALSLADWAILDTERFTPEVRDVWRKKFDQYFRAG
jgi:iron(III) transport system substrate-binding protein